jgi:heme/copper-type cytochrome/quinol oxidase subunit 2
MLSRSKLISIWVVATLSTAGACYAFVTTVTLTLLTATGAWSEKRAWLWASIALVLFCLFGVVALKTVVRLIRYYDRHSRHPDSGDASKP